MAVSIREARIDDIVPLSESLRLEDAVESIRQGNATCTDALVDSFGQSELRFTLEKDGKPVAMFGLMSTTLLGNRAWIWLLGTNELATIKKTFCKLSRKVVEQFLNQYPILTAQVDSRYEATHRWLEWLGAKKGITYKHNGFEFNDFNIERR